MDKAVGIVLGIVGNANGNSHLQRCLQAVFPELLVNRDILERKDAHGNGTDLIMPHRDEIPIGSDHPYGISFLDALINMMDST